MPKKQTTGQTTLKIQTPQPPPGTQKWVIQQLTQKPKPCKREAQLTPCPNCKTITLYGYNEDIAAYPTRADPTILTYQQQEILHAAGRPLYQLTTNQTGTAWHLYYATGPNHARIVLTDHKCGYPPPGKPLLQPPQKQPDQPPF